MDPEEDQAVDAFEAELEDSWYELEKRRTIALERQAEIAQSALEVEREKLAAIREQSKIMRELWLKLAEMAADIDLIEQHLKGLGTIFNEAAE